MRKWISNSYICPSIAGRLGNNLFMIAHAYAQAIQQNRQLIVPSNQVGHMDDFRNNIFRKIDTYIDMPVNSESEASTIYTGYFQSEKYFKSYSESIKSLFSPTQHFIQNIAPNYPVNGSDPVTAISVRRGDYLIYQNYHPVITKEYIMTALKEIPRSDHYLIFSDDIDWCKHHLSDLPNSIFVELQVHDQLWLMSLCDNFVISNSSFSWWGAYLSRSIEKRVIAPETWFGPDGPSDWQDMYCQDWTVLPTYFKDGLIYPKIL